MAQPDAILAVHRHAVGIACFFSFQPYKHAFIGDGAIRVDIEGVNVSFGGVGVVHGLAVQAEGGAIGDGVVVVHFMLIFRWQERLHGNLAALPG